MYTSDDHLMKKTFWIALGCSIFFGIFTAICYRFSHDVYSDYMTYLGLIPLVLGALPALIIWRKDIQAPGYLPYHTYFSGVAALTMASCLKGIFDIAGNSSVYQTYLMYFGIASTLLGVLLYGISLIWKSSRYDRSHDSEDLA